MSRKIEFDLYENGKEVDKIEKETSVHPTQLMKSLEEFRQIVNVTLTKKIEDAGVLEDYIEDHDVESDGEEEIDQQISSKKRKV